MMANFMTIKSDFNKVKEIGLLLIVMLFSNQALPQTFSVIGDYGSDDAHELDVANLVKNWNPDFIVTVGDNNYVNGEASTIDQNIGQYYHDYIKPYLGNTILYGNGSPDVNRFFPVPGNHDWDASPDPSGDLTPYLKYFSLPNNERYYDFIWDDVHFFMIDSDPREPDGNNQTSVQALWIKDKMETSTAKWKIVVLHHAPYSSSGSTNALRWPFKTWGADAVIAGHKHNYERLIVDNLVYFVDGLGGYSRQSFNSPLTESIVRYKDDYGAMLVVATYADISFYFYNVADSLIDSYVIDSPTPVELASFEAMLNGNRVDLYWRTETEVNNYGFIIKRSSPSHGTIWETIGFVEGYGNSNSPKEYNYSDTNIKQSGKYNYRLKQIDNDGTYEYSDIVTVEVNVPDKFYLSQNYPNPFNPNTKIDFTIPEKNMVSLKVFNPMGELVSELVNETKEPGKYSVDFEASNLTSGIYIYRLHAGNFISNRKMILLK